ncbi:MAG: hypothetical protein H7259_05350 [Cytophagales bacterium]|nr:hypothetical protein [Cytophaga sp.]
MQKIDIYSINAQDNSPVFFTTVEDVSLYVTSNDSSITIGNGIGQILFSGPLDKFAILSESVVQS